MVFLEGSQILAANFVCGRSLQTSLEIRFKKLRITNFKLVLGEIKYFRIKVTSQVKKDHHVKSVLVAWPYHARGRKGNDQGLEFLRHAPTLT